MVEPDTARMTFAPITVGDQTFVVSDEGHGRPVVLLHGFPDLPASWAGIGAALRRAGHRTITPYLRGYHPDTIVVDRPYDASTVADDVLRLVDALDLDRPVLVGHDWGATCVYGAVEARPDGFSGMVPIAIAPPSALKPSAGLLWDVRHFAALKMPWAAAATRRGNFAYVDRLYQRWAPNWSGPERDAARDGVKAAFDDPVVLDGALDWYRALSIDRNSPPEGFEVPGLVVIGAEDMGAEAASRAPGAFTSACDVMTVAGAGHWPHREAEDAFIERLLAYLADLPE